MYILSIDQGTTGTTAVLIETNSFTIVDKINQEHDQIFPKPGYVEHNLNDIWTATQTTITKILSKNNIDPKSISAIGITNQRETTCAFNNAGAPLANAIVWQDRRTARFCNELKERGLEDSVRHKTGLPLDPYFSATKMKWFIDNNQSVKSALTSNDLKFGNIDTYLLYKLTAGTSYKTDVTNASRTLLMSLDSLNWDDELLDIFNITKDILPEIQDSVGLFGHTKGLSFLPDGIPISGILGDQQAALFGQACFSKGESKCTYGTGAFMLLNTGNEKVYSNSGLLTTVAYKHKDTTMYALEGSSYIAGACVQWLRDNMKFFKSAQEIENLAKSIENLDRVREIFFLPFFTGIGSPYWNPNARAAILGLSRDSGQAEISRAALEGIALSINDLLNAMESDLGEKVTSLKVDGGAVANNLLMEIQANFSLMDIVRPKVIETTAYGAGLAAAIGVELTTIDKLQGIWSEDQTFSPSSNSTDSRDYYLPKKSEWTNYIKRLF
ncbi:glycerol kinase GlpK [Bacteriovorax sp. Seq25_V]|uniref:glycerol kinase GlpK n=1 Tax=Bacteriovorax sp. Seq25_V TaxID=1201288 RepID=UPI00038A1CF7|nr:glycerol kinase GlpK [Bacteriovorax sp. Seq25_V]EQC43234.1 glycerol kinase [Bacteriovorax sp. Seq25_V]